MLTLEQQKYYNEQKQKRNAIEETLLEQLGHELDSGNKKEYAKLRRQYKKWIFNGRPLIYKIQE